MKCIQSNALVHTQVHMCSVAQRIHRRQCATTGRGGYIKYTIEYTLVCFQDSEVKKFGDYQCKTIPTGSQLQSLNVYHNCTTWFTAL